MQATEIAAIAILFVVTVVLAVELWRALKDTLGR